MPLWLAVVLLIAALTGIALACVVYIGLTVFFVDAVSHQEPIL